MRFRFLPSADPVSEGDLNVIANVTVNDDADGLTEGSIDVSINDDTEWMTDESIDVMINGRINDDVEGQINP